jgi:hypothetical protein
MARKITIEAEPLTLDFHPCGPLADGYSCGYIVDGRLETLNLKGPCTVELFSEQKKRQLLADFPFAFFTVGGAPGKPEEKDQDPPAKEAAQPPAGNKAGMPPNPVSAGPPEKTDGDEEE